MATAVLAFAGCSGDSGAESGTSAGGTADESAASSGSGSHDGPTSTTSSKTDDTDSHDTDKLTLTISGDETTIEPTDVYCSGPEGNIHHIIGKTDDGLPLVKAEGTHFAMVKTGNQRPYKTESPSGIEYGKDRVTFEDTSLGSGTLSGTMTCTEWEE